MDVKGIDIPSVFCGFCNSDMEDVVHVFLTYELAMELWGYFGRWCDIRVRGFSVLEEVMQWIDLRLVLLEAMLMPM